MLVPTELLFKLNIAKDRVRFLRLYSGLSFILGVGIAFTAHRPSYNNEPSKPSFLYRLHLSRLLSQNKIDREKHDKYLDFGRV